DLRDRLRVWNRLNHRKLFLVEENGQTCAIIGGRNLGDSYLTSHNGSFHDGDLCFCGEKESDFMKDAHPDLDELKFDTSDRVIDQVGKTVLHEVPVRRGYRYIYLQPDQIHYVPANMAKIKTVVLPNFSEPKLLTSIWDNRPNSDEIRMELLRAI